MMTMTMKNLIWRFFLTGFAGLLTTSAHAQDAGIHKCTAPDGSVSYQQNDCPLGTTGKNMAINSAPARTLTLPPNSNHQYSTTLTINGVSVPGYIDTGASFVTLSASTATRMHIGNDNLTVNVLQTANGNILGARKALSVIKIGQFEVYNVEVVIVENSPTLIGMSALSQLRFAIENGSMVISKR